MNLTPLAVKWAGAGMLAFALFLFAHSIIGNPDSLANRYFARYVGHLERNLRNMFISTSGRRIAAVQAVAIALILGCKLVFVNPLIWLALPVAVAGPTLYIGQLRRKRLKAIEASMDGFILALANALKSTPSIGSALSYCSSLLRGPLEQEIALTLKEIRVGTGLEQALLNMAGRVQSMQLDATFASILIGRKVGGDLGKILETTAETLREMARLQGVVKSKTAEGKAQLMTLVFLPVVIVFVFDLVSDGYFAPLTQSATGFMVIAVSFLLWCASLVLARAVLRVDL